MIITHNHMIGLPVIDVENGFRVGLVEDLVVNASKKEVEGVILKGGTFRKRKVIDLKNIHSFVPFFAVYSALFCASWWLV